MAKNYTSLRQCNDILKKAILQVTGVEPTTDFRFVDESEIQQVTQTIAETHGKNPEINHGDSFLRAGAAVYLEFN